MPEEQEANNVEILLNPKPQSFACLATDDAMVMAFRKVDRIDRWN
ncbi:MAG: hypothetical protein WBG32_21200 [Nodosilinea sp.]